jgi:cation diffusion facilitator family transporter
MPHAHDLRPFRHSHAFADDRVRERERALARVTAITLLAMLVELAAGWWSASLALTADGWHMGTHALALGGAVLAYRMSARAVGHAGFAFGGWKIEVLTAYTSGLLLLGAAAWIGADAVARLRAPQPVAYREAMAVALLGLGVNVLSAWMLLRGQGGHAGHGHDGHDHHHHHDHNFSAAYLHVIADAFTSVLAIVALGGGLWFGWDWLDAVVALFGAAVIAQWSLGVLRASGKALVDATADAAISERIHDLVEADGDAKIADLHVWQVGANAWAAAISLVADQPLAAADYRARLGAIAPLRHATIEVHRCQGESRA